jgi:hypothetical protein
LASFSLFIALFFLGVFFLGGVGVTDAVVFAG